MKHLEHNLLTLAMSYLRLSQNIDSEIGKKTSMYVNSQKSPGNFLISIQNPPKKYYLGISTEIKIRPYVKKTFSKSYSPTKILQCQIVLQMILYKYLDGLKNKGPNKVKMILRSLKLIKSIKLYRKRLKEAIHMINLGLKRPYSSFWKMCYFSKIT